MASTEGLVPITRNFLASYYDKYPAPPLSDDVSRLSSQIRSLANDLLLDSPPSQEESLLIEEADRQPPHKIDENMWKNREHMEETIFLLERSHWPATLQQSSAPEDVELANVLGKLSEKFEKTLNTLKSFQAVNSDRIFNTVMTYMPQDFRGALIRQQRERSERNKQAEVDALVNSGGSIRDRYSLMWKQQMDRRRQLAQLGSATGVYKTLVKYLVGVPQKVVALSKVLLDFVRQINDDDGGVFANSPFFISAEAAGALETRKNDEYKEITIPAGKNFEVSFSVDSVNSYIAWDFSVVQGKISTDIGFSLEYTNESGEKTVLRYRVDCIPPVVEPMQPTNEAE
ncbi:GOLD domain-containing protein [Citrus sinensis]|uniref:GOLD domain-containing protein n=1 Tax=Citrus sinensis TaxID=2711 RepID=A0ACB8JX43_CITSI|nr:GOLD domain-containing protein [Citrus sinensis]